MATPSQHVPDRASVCALVAAAGLGLRLGLGPKAFLRHRGLTLLEHAVAYLEPAAARILVGVPPGTEQEAMSLVGSPAVTCMAGGATKQETVGRLLDAAAAPFVLVHDAVQLDPDPRLLDRVLTGLGEADAVVPVLPMPLRGATLLTDAAGLMTAAVPRERLRVSQTPQGFRRQALVSSFGRASREGWSESGIYALVHRAGYRVRTVPGDPDQIKVTYPEDLERLDTA